MTHWVLRLLACAGFVAAGLLIGGGIASADSGLGGLGIGHEKNNDNNKPRNEAPPIRPPIVRIGAREDRGGFEVGPGGIRISQRPGYRGGFAVSPGGPRLTIDERGIRGAINLGPRGARVTFGRGWSGGSDMRGERGAQSQAELSPSGTRVASENVGAPDGRGTTPGIGRAAMAQRLTIYIPVPRPSATGARTQSPFTTVVISVPTGSILRASGQPQPQPTPSPRLRIGEVPTDKPDVEVIDSSGQGGSDEAPANDSQPISAPVVIVPPLAAPPRPAPPSAPPVSPPVPGAAPPPAAGRPGGQVHAPTSIVAGAPPRMRERAPSPAPAPAPGAVPVDMPATRPGYRQYLRTAKTTDLAVVALPGLAGLVLMTVTGTIVGQRQARAAQMLRHSGAIRFMA